MTRIRNDLFDGKQGFNLGRPRIVFIAWYVVKWIFFLSAFPYPSGLKSHLLRLFGAKIGKSVYWKPRVNINMPWNLQIGDHAWIGEEVLIINFALITVGAHCCLSQRSILCSGNHDYRTENMRYRHAPVMLSDGVWVGAGAFIGPGVIIGMDAVITATSVVTHSLEGEWIYSGNPCKAVRKRWPVDKIR